MDETLCVWLPPEPPGQILIDITTLADGPLGRMTRFFCSIDELSIVKGVINEECGQRKMMVIGMCARHEGRLSMFAHVCAEWCMQSGQKKLISSWSTHQLVAPGRDRRTNYLRRHAHRTISKRS